MMARGASTVQVAPLARRLVATLIDLAPLLALAALAVGLPAAIGALSSSLATGIALGVGLAWLAYLCAQYAVNGAGPGYRMMDLSLRDVDTGEPIGWGRYLLRQAVAVGLSLTVIGGVVLVATIVINPRGRGWHDQVARSIAVYRPQGSAAALDTPAWRPTDEADVQRWAPQPDTQQVQVSSSSPESPPEAPTQVAVAATAVASAASPAAAPASATSAAEPDPASTEPAGPDSVAAEPPAAPPVPVPPPKATVLTPPPDAYEPPPSIEGDPLSAETPILPESARAEALESARQRGWLAQEQIAEERNLPGSAETTRLSVEQPGDFGWYLVLDDGRQVDISRPLVIGRNPIAPADRPNALAVRVGESGQAVSKSHLSVSVDGSGLFVVDLGSTNGTAIVGTTGALEPCKAHQEVRVRDGQVVSFGDHAFTVRRRFGR